MRWSDAFFAVPSDEVAGLKARPHASLVVYYDETCDFCTRIAQRLDRINWLGRVRFREAREHPTLQSRQYDDIQAIRKDGECYSGLPTYRQIAWRIPILWLLAPLLYIRPFKTIAAKMYRKAADSRECLPDLRDASFATEPVDHLARLSPQR